MAILTSMAVGAGGKIIDEVIGQIGADRRLKKNEAAQKRLNEHQKELDYDLWQKTNYPAQVDQMRKAGLNPSLMYGGGGAGGATTGSSAGSVQSGNSQSGAMDLAAANQMRLMEAQAKNLEADTKKKEVEAAKIGGADTENVMADTEVKKATARIQQVAANVANETQEDQIKAITYAANEQVEKARERFNIAQVAEEGQQAEIAKIKASAISEGLNAILIENQIGKTRAETRKITEEIKQNWQKVAQGWKGLDIQDKTLKLQEFKTEIEAQYPNVWNVAGRAIDDMITEIVTLGGKLGERHKTKTIK